MIIEYKSKNERELKSNVVDATLIDYEINESDMLAIADNLTLEYQLNRYFLTQDYKLFNMVVDNIDNGLVVVGGKIGDKFILTQYIVRKGLNELLFQLSLR